MSAWNDFLNLIGFRRPSAARTQPSRVPRPSRPTSENELYPGAIHSGMVIYVDRGFAKISFKNTIGIVFLRGISVDHVTTASDVLTEGQKVDFVLMEPSKKVVGEWIVSLAAVGEARVRNALSRVNEEDVIQGKVRELSSGGAKVDSDGVPVWIPLSEIAWEWIRHSSDVLRLGDSVDVKVLRIEVPEGWSKHQTAQIVGSIRDCVVRPASPSVKMPVRCFPFKVTAVARKPRSCDPVVSHIMEELYRNVDRETIRENTGLPDSTLAQIYELLEQEGFMQGHRLTERGRGLANAMIQAKEHNLDPVSGWFASAAPLESQFIKSADLDNHDEYPRAWPKAPRDRRIEDEFSRAANETFPEVLIDHVVGPEKRDEFLSLLRDDRLSVFLRRDGWHYRDIKMSVPEHWVFAGLWSKFEAVGTYSFRPTPGTEGCQRVLLVRLRGTRALLEELSQRHRGLIHVHGVDAKKRQEQKLEPEILAQLLDARRAYRELVALHEGNNSEWTVYFEPNTETYWKPRTGRQGPYRIYERKTRGLPNTFPEIEKVTRALNQKTINWKPEAWCEVWI